MLRKVSEPVKLLYCGDVVGRAGRDAIVARVPELRRSLGLDFVLVNGENAAAGFGITGKICEEFYAAGVDVIVLGNHAWDQRETLSYINGDPRLLRPLNYPKGTPGKGAGLFTLQNGKKVLVIQVMGRIFMDPLDDPFAAVEHELKGCVLSRDADAIVIDIHAEATSEKQAMGHFVDGRASLVVGTHTHAPTADHQILANGTAYMTDAGMTGDYDSVIGMVKDEPLSRFLRKIASAKFEAATGAPALSGVAVETDDATGLAQRVAAVRLGARLQEARPAFWE